MGGGIRFVALFVLLNALWENKKKPNASRKIKACAIFHDPSGAVKTYKKTEQNRTGEAPNKC